MKLEKFKKNIIQFRGTCFALRIIMVRYCEYTCVYIYIFRYVNKFFPLFFSKIILLPIVSVGQIACFVTRDSFNSQSSSELKFPGLNLCYHFSHKIGFSPWRAQTISVVLIS